MYNAEWVLGWRRCLYVWALNNKQTGDLPRAEGVDFGEAIWAIGSSEISCPLVQFTPANRQGHQTTARVWTYNGPSSAPSRRPTRSALKPASERIKSETRARKAAPAGNLLVGNRNAALRFLVTPPHRGVRGGAPTRTEP